MAFKQPIDTPWKLYGSKDPIYVAGGHSHTVCMLLAITEKPDVHQNAAVVYSSSLSGNVPSDASYWQFLADTARDKVAVIVWNGNQHQAAFLISSDPPFRVYNPNVRLVNPLSDKQLGSWIPRTVFRDYWDWTYKEFEEAISAISRHSQLVVVGTPPPKTDQTIREVLQNDPTILEAAKDKGIEPHEVGLTAPCTRLALWNVIQDEMEELTLKAGGTFVPVPAKARDLEGYLLPEFSWPDATHTNSKYGSLIWEEIYKLSPSENAHG